VKLMARKPSRGNMGRASRSEQRENSGVPRVRGRPFRKGKSGNPGGRPKGSHDLRQLAQAHTAEAIDRLVRWMRTSNPKASVAACIALLDRGWGKPVQAIMSNEGAWKDVNIEEVRRSIQRKLDRIAAHSGYSLQQSENRALAARAGVSDAIAITLAKPLDGESTAAETGSGK
jgi:hypothetical protein